MIPKIRWTEVPIVVECIILALIGCKKRYVVVKTIKLLIIHKLYILLKTQWLRKSNKLRILKFIISFFPSFISSIPRINQFSYRSLSLDANIINHPYSIICPLHYITMKIIIHFNLITVITYLVNKNVFIIHRSSMVA